METETESLREPLTEEKKGSLNELLKEVMTVIVRLMARKTLLDATREKKKGIPQSRLARSILSNVVD